jgi:cytochrome c biogenesis factor
MDAGLVGRILLYAAIATSAWGATASLLGRRRHDPRLATSGRRGLYATTGLLVAAAVWLALALMRHDFSILYVTQVTSRSTRFPY